MGQALPPVVAGFLPRSVNSRPGGARSFRYRNAGVFRRRHLCVAWNGVPPPFAGFGDVRAGATVTQRRPARKVSIETLAK